MKFIVRVPAYAVAALIFVSLGGPMLNAQGFTQIYPSWEVNAINDMIHWNGDTLFACGNEWTLLRSIDAGKTWEEMFDYTTGKHFRKMTAGGSELFIHAMRGVSKDADSSFLTMYAYQPHSNRLREFQVPRYFKLQHEDDFYYIQYVDSTLYVLEGNYYNAGRLHASRDFGSTWTSLDLPAMIKITSAERLWGASRMHFISEDIGVIVSQDTADKYNLSIFRTTDAGTNWERLPGKYPIKSICMATPSGQNGVTAFLTIGLQAWKSEDSCKTWTELGVIPWNSGNSPGTVAMNFPTPDIGYIAAAASDVYGTTDGGATWVQLKETAYVGGPSAIATLNDGVVLISNAGSHFFRSGDAGITWQTDRLPQFTTIRALAFRDALNGVVTAFNHNRDYMAFSTTDGGATWAEAAFLMNPYIIDSLQVALYNWVVMQSDTIQFHQYEALEGKIHASIYRLTDLGSKLTLIRSWAPGTAPPGGEYSAIGTLHFLKGDKGTAYSYDDGKTWRFAAHTDSINSSSKIEFSTTADGRLVAYCMDRSNKLGRFATVYKSLDSCKTWISIYPPIDYESMIWELDVLGPDDVVFNLRSSNGNELYRTTDGGATWNLLAEKPPGFVTTYYYPPVAYRFQWPGITVYKSEDVWNTKTLLMSYNGYSGPGQIYFDDQWNGWIAGDFVIYRTSTGGVDWVRQPGIIEQGASITSIYPNPVSTQGAATVEYTLPATANISLTLYNALGQELRRIEKRMEPGAHTERIAISGLVPGIYYYTLLAGRHRETKMVVVR